MKPPIYFFLVIILICLLLPGPLLPAQSTAGNSPGEADIDVLKKRLEHTRGKERLDVLLKLMAQTSSKSPSDVLTLGKDALEVLKNDPDPVMEINVLNRLSVAASRLGRVKQMDAFSSRSLELAHKTGDKESLANSLRVRGLYMYRMGKYPNAAGFYKRAEALYRELNSHKDLGRLMDYYGQVYLKVDDYPRALEYFLKACKAHRKMNDLHRAAYSHNSVGIIHSHMKSYDKALEYYYKSLEILKKNNDLTGIAMALNNIAIIYSRKKQDKEALKLYKRSLAIKEKIGNLLGTANTLSNIGDLYQRLKDYKLAREYYRKSLEIRNKLGNRKGISGALVDMGKVERCLKRYKSAGGYLLEAVKLALESSYRIELGDAYKELSNFYKDTGDYSTALAYNKKFKAISDEIFSAGGARKISELQARYELESREKEIALLKKKKRLRDLELKNPRMLYIMLFIGCFLVLILIIVNYTRFRLKTDLNRRMRNEIEEHKLTAERLRESEQKFRHFSEETMVGMCILQDKKVKYANPSLLNLFKFKLPEVIGQSPLDFVFKEDRPIVEDIIARAVAGDMDTRGNQFRAVTRDGEIIYAEAYGGYFKFERKPALLFTVIDITERKRSERELLKLRETEAAGMLADGIAHDFNNLLAIIIGNLDMIKEDIGTGSESYQGVELMEYASQKAAILARRLLELSREERRAADL